VFLLNWKTEQPSYEVKTAMEKTVIINLATIISTAALSTINDVIGRSLVGCRVIYP
jgi:hypothetical protein